MTDDARDAIEVATALGLTCLAFAIVVAVLYLGALIRDHLRGPPKRKDEP